jgi:hypothetical protein
MAVRLRVPQSCPKHQLLPIELLPIDAETWASRFKRSMIVECSSRLI